MKYKIKDTELWVETKGLRPILSLDYDLKFLSKFMNEEQLDNYKKVIDLEKPNVRKEYSYSLEYIFIPVLKNKEPLGKVDDIDNIDFLVNEYYPALNKLKKSIAPLETQQKTEKHPNGYRVSSHQLFTNINNTISNLKAGSKLIIDIHNGKMQLERVESEASTQNYLTGMRAYVCGGSDNLFLNSQKCSVKLNNAQLYESLEAAKKTNPNSPIFEIHLKLMGPSLTKVSSIDKEIIATQTRNALEETLEHKPQTTKKNKI